MPKAFKTIWPYPGDPHHSAKGMPTGFPLSAMRGKELPRRLVKVTVTIPLPLSVSPWLLLFFQYCPWVFNIFTGIQVTILTIFWLRFLFLDSPYLTLLGLFLASLASGLTLSTCRNPVSTRIRQIFDQKFPTKFSTQSRPKN